MMTEDPVRVQKVIDFAAAQIDLEGIASGQADEIGLEARLRHHRVLDWLLQELGRFRGLGWSVIAAALRSPVVRNRNWALQALSAWGVSSWPDEAPALLEQALADEPMAEVASAFSMCSNSALWTRA